MTSATPTMRAGPHRSRRPGRPGPGTRAGRRRRAAHRPPRRARQQRRHRLRRARRPYPRTSADGYELRFAVNYLAGFLLTLKLLPLLRRSAPARIVNVASIGQHPLDFADLMLEHGYSGTRAYGQSKLAQIMSGFELASRVPAAEVTVNSLHPATFMPTKIVLSEIGHHVDSLEEGVAATARLTSSPALAGVSGKFFDRTRPATAHPQAYDARARTELWDRSLQLTRQA